MPSLNVMYKSLSGQAPSTWSMMFSYLLTAVGVYFDQPTTEHASFHGHRTVSATEPFLWPDIISGTICHRNCDTWTSALDNSKKCWNRISLGFSQPRRIVTFLLLRLRSFLLTYLPIKMCTTAHSRISAAGPCLSIASYGWVSAVVISDVALWGPLVLLSHVVEKEPLPPASSLATTSLAAALLLLTFFPFS